MSTAKLGRLKKIDLRKAWDHEALDFTNWLAQEENLALLADEIQIEMRLIQTEASVGKFNADILAEEENTGHKIIIENQLEVSNHDHLGKIVTYASGIDAQIIVWIVKEAREEHIRAIDWLNEHTDGNVNYFLIEMELWQIGVSEYAPKFQVISQPNDWAKAVKQSASGSGKISETKAQQLEFWTALKEYVDEQKTTLRFRKPLPQHWYDINIGSGEAHLALTINSQQNQLACEVYVHNSKDLYYFLEGKKEQIEQELGYKLQWMALEGKKASRIKYSREADINETSKWPEYHKWALETTDQFHRVFVKLIKQFK